MFLQLALPLLIQQWTWLLREEFFRESSLFTSTPEKLESHCSRAKRNPPLMSGRPTNMMLFAF